MKEKIKSLIDNWVEVHYGSNELEDPSWDSDLLAEYLAEKIFEKQS